MRLRLEEEYNGLGCEDDVLGQDDGVLTEGAEAWNAGA